MNVSPFLGGDLGGSSEEKVITSEEIEEKHKKELLEMARARIKESALYGILMGYYAIREENIGICDTIDSKFASQRCRETFNEFMPDRYMGEGRCSLIKNSDKRHICRALKEDNCSGLGDKNRGICEALEKGDPRMLLRAFNTAGYRYSYKDSLISLAFFSGYRYYSIIPCERYAKDLTYEKKLGCMILFSDNADIIEDFVEDLTILSFSRLKNDLEACKMIKNSTIRKACENRNIEDVDALVMK